VTPSCLKCGAAYELEVPDIWVSKHPELKGACPECAVNRVYEIMREAE
jgi:hypothetical protein